MENLRIVKDPYWLVQYKKALRERNMPEWPLLKEKLMGPNSYQALFYLEQFLMARKASTIAYNAYHAPGLTEEEWNRLHNEYWEVSFHRFKILDSLNSL
jgi:hypothetical protein